MAVFNGIAGKYLIIFLAVFCEALPAFPKIKKVGSI